MPIGLSYRITGKQEKALRIAQAGYYPKLNLSAGYSTGYYHNFGDGDYNNAPFSDQLKNNGQKSIGLSLSIPIFNRFQVRNSVRTARLSITNRELMMENSKKSLYKEIQQAYYTATAAQEKYISNSVSDNIPPGLYGALSSGSPADTAVP